MDIEVLRRQNDEQAKRIRKLEERVRVLEAEANPVQVQALEECVESHALAEKKAYKKLDAAEAVTRSYKFKLERQGRQLATQRVALEARPTNGNGADRDGSSLLLGIGENRVHVDPGEQS